MVLFEFGQSAMVSIKFSFYLFHEVQVIVVEFRLSPLQIPIV